MKIFPNILIILNVLNIILKKTLFIISDLSCTELYL